MKINRRLKYNFVYKTTNLVNNKIYIGRHSTNNLNDGYLGTGSKHYQNSIKKYGRKNFKREILEFFYNFEELCKAEEKYIKQFNSIDDKVGYNKTTDSNGWGDGENNPMYGKTGELNPMYGRKHSEETRDKISKKISGENHPQYGKTSEKSHNYGRKFSKEHRIKIGKNNPLTGLRGENHPNFGRVKTKETIEKIRIASTGRTHSEETKEKIRKINTGKTFSEKTKKKIKEYAKNRPKIKCPYCKTFVDKTTANRWHFDNCKQNPKNNKEDVENFRRISHVGYNKESPTKGMTWRQKKVECPYCYKIGGVSNMKKYHFDNCKNKFK